MSAPLPTPPEVAKARKLVLQSPSLLRVDDLCTAQHRATRRATLEEVQAMTGPATPLLNAWLTQQIAEAK